MNPTLSTFQTKYNFPLFLALIAAGLAGNYFSYPVFLNIYFLFGSIFAMLALQFFGLCRGILAAAIIAGYTYILFNHPYAIVIMTAEVTVVGLLMKRRKMGLVLADMLYWLIIGMPLVYLFYSIVMGSTPSNTYITMTKQAMNGIANALVARLIYTGYALRTRTILLSYREIIYNLLIFFVLCPTLILLTISSRTDFAETDLRIKNLLIENVEHEDLILDSWAESRKTAIVNLAEMAATRSPLQMQPYLELEAKADKSFLRVGLHNKEATTTAYTPLLDELGNKNIGKNFADRPFIPIIKKTLKPMLSEVVMGRVGVPGPRVSMLAPVLSRGQYNGYIIGVLSLDQIKSHLEKSMIINNTFYTLLDQNGKVILTNRTDQKIMAPFERGKGGLQKLDNRISQWIPTLPPNTPKAERWKSSFYVTEAGIGALDEWKLILEQPVAPFQKKLFNNYTGKLIQLFLILLGSLALAEILSRKFVVTLEKLTAVTHAVPDKLLSDDKAIDWPVSGFKETHQLIGDFRKMLELIAERNQKISLQVEQMGLAQEMARVGYWSFDIKSGMPTWSSMMFDIFGCDPSKGGPIYADHQNLIHPDDWLMFDSAVQGCIAGNPLHMVIRVIFPDRSIHFVDTQGYPQYTVDGKIETLIGTSQDITALKQLEEDRRTYIPHLVEVIEQERFRTARELHDEIGQKLTLFSFAISNLMLDQQGSKEGPQALLDMQVGVDSMMQSIRRICTGLRPALLDELGLSTALAWLSKDFTRLSGVPCSFSFEGDCCNSNMECQMTVFRIIQESLNNTMKHATASQVCITLSRVNNAMQVKINDDGCGFITKKDPDSRTFGIMGMRERASSIGASFEIVSNKGHGTSVKLVIPCNGREGADAISHC